MPFQHRNLTGSDAVHPAAFVASSDPGAVGADKFWVDTSSGPPYALKKRNAANSAWEAVGGGTVSSVALTVPAEFSVSGSPVTSTGTLAVTKANQNENLVYAGPSSGSATAPAFRALVPLDLVIPYVHIQDQKTAGTDAGTSTSGSWQTRTLNTEVNDSASIATLASNQVTLPAGTYITDIIVPGYQIGLHKARLRNTTAGTTLCVGTSEITATSSSGSASFITGQFTLSVSSALEVQHRCGTTSATTGFGRASNFDEVEVYTVARFWKIS
jgi:hypothetical protein